MSAQGAVRDQNVGIELSERADGRYAVDLARYSDEPLSTIIICSVAAVVGKDPITLDSLRAVIDPGALESVANSTTDGVISFRYGGCSISIECGSTLYIRPEFDAAMA